jgi:hypothetical protein
MIGKYNADQWKDAYIDYLYDNFPINNGHKLVELMERSALLADFLDANGLSLEKWEEMDL